MNDLEEKREQTSWRGRSFALTGIVTWGFFLIFASAGFRPTHFGALQVLLTASLVGLCILIAATVRHASRDKNRSESRLQALANFASQLSKSGSANDALGPFLQFAVRELGAAGGYLMLADENDPKLLKLELGFSANEQVSFPEEVRMGEGITGYVFEKDQPISIRHKRSGGSDLNPGVIGDGCAMCVPIDFKPLLVSGNDQTTQTLGALTVVGKSFRSDDLPFLLSAASLISVAVSKSRIEGKQLSNFMSTIQSLATAFESRDEYTRGHSGRVCALSIMLAESLGFSSEDINEIRIGTILHDIGKVGIPESIVNKKGRLTEAEFSVMRTYPLIGSDLCKSLVLSEGALIIIRNHRERLDGSGYPDGLKGGELPAILRVVCVADAFDAMGSARPYRRAMEADEVFAELSLGAGVHFDPMVVEALRDLIKTSKFREIFESPVNGSDDSTISDVAA